MKMYRPIFRASSFKLLIALVLVTCVIWLYKLCNSNHYLAVSSTAVLGPTWKTKLAQSVVGSPSKNHGVSNFDTNSNTDFGQQFTSSGGTNTSALTNVLQETRVTTVTNPSLIEGDDHALNITDSSLNSDLLSERHDSVNRTQAEAGPMLTKKNSVSSSRGYTSAASSISNTLESATNVPDKANSEYDVVYTNTTKSFLLDGSFTSPWPSSRSVESIQKEAWFKELATFLDNSVPHLPIVLVSSDSDFQDALLNWLISALLRQNDPVSNILVLTYQPSLCVFINSKKIVNCISILPETLTAEGAYRHKKNNGMRRLLLIRVFVMRLLTYWGYDVANFDTDAILLKNPIPVLLSQEFSNSDVIGTFGGTLPGALHNKWGVVLCMGAIFLRSTSHTELLWESMRRVNQRDDQIKMNYGLDNLHVRWTTRNFNQTDRQDDLSKLWEGEAEGGLRVTLLPQRIACRGSGCQQDSKHSCYIWHHGRNQHKSKNMIGQAKNDGVWFLRKDWQRVPSFYTGWDWLRAISIDT